MQVSFSPLISVVVPVFRTGQYLPACLESLFYQTYKNLEILLVCDGDDDEKSLCKDFAKRYENVYYISGEGQGLGGARNLGISCSSGEYIAFLDSDDWIEPDAFYNVVSVFQKNRNVDLVVFGVNVVGQDGTNSERLRDYLNIKDEGLFFTSHDVVMSINVQVWNKVFKSQIVKDNDIRFPSLLNYEDFPFYFQYAFLAKQVFFCRKKLYNYRQRPGSGMAATYGHNFDKIKDHVYGCVFLWRQLLKKNILLQYFEIFELICGRWLMTALSYCKQEDKIRLLKLAKAKFSEFYIDRRPGNKIIKLLLESQFDNIINGYYEKKIYYKLGFPVFSLRYRFNGKKSLYFFDKLKLFSWR